MSRLPLLCAFLILASAAGSSDATDILLVSDEVNPALRLPEDKAAVLHASRSDTRVTLRVTVQLMCGGKLKAHLFAWRDVATISFVQSDYRGGRSCLSVRTLTYDIPHLGRQSKQSTWHMAT